MTNLSAEELGFTIEDRGECRVLVWSGNNGCRPASDEECTMWDAITAWQRTQSAGVPEDLRAEMLAVIDRSDWRTAANRAELRALLAAAPAQPAAQDDDLLLELEGLRESLETARHNWRAFEDRCGDLQVENGKLRDRIAAAQGEVQRLLKDYRALLVARRFPDNDEGDFGARIRDQELLRIDAALAASTGQEVKP